MARIIEGSKFKTQLHEQVLVCIKENLKHHTIQQLHKEGDAGRIWRCTNNGSSVYGFTVLAPPGWLIMTGDMGECMWSRHRDMLPFIRGSIGSLSYFSEKVPREVKIMDEYTELATEWLEEAQSEYEERHAEPMTDEELEQLADIQSSYETYGDPSDLRRAIYESPLYNGDTSSVPSLQYYTYQYLWKIEALKWFIDRIDSGVFEVKEFTWEI